MIVREVPELRIVEQQLWDECKARQAELCKNTRPDCVAERPFWARTRPKYLLSGLLRCGSCGGAYTKINANLFGCATARNKGTCGNRLNIRTDVIELMVLDGLKWRLMDSALFEEFAAEFTRELNRRRAAENNRADQTKAEVRRLDSRVKRIVDAIAEGIPARSLRDELLSLEARRDELQARLAPCDPLLPLIHPALPEQYRRRVASLHEALKHEPSRDEAMHLIRALIESIILTPENGKLRIEVRGELAALALSAAGKKPGPSDRASAEQIKMVAGIGFEPMTFRL
jgi:site-specific DNA recombinase